MRAIAMLILTLVGLALAAGPFLISARSAARPVAGIRLRIPWRLRLRLALAGGDLGLMFFRRGKSSARLVLTIANKAAPTAAELTAGTDLSKAVAAIAGFETTLNRINQPVMAYSEELQIDGPQTFADASMTLLEDDDTGVDGDSVARVAAYTALDEGTSGYIVLAPKKAGALVATDDCEVWPIRVGARNRGWGLETEAARYVVQFAITGPPEKDAVVAA